MICCTRVEKALRGENIELPAGTLEADNIDLTLNLDKSYNSVETIEQLPIKKSLTVQLFFQMLQILYYLKHKGKIN